MHSLHKVHNEMAEIQRQLIATTALAANQGQPKIFRIMHTATSPQGPLLAARREPHRVACNQPAKHWLSTRVRVGALLTGGSLTVLSALFVISLWPKKCRLTAVAQTASIAAPPNTKNIRPITTTRLAPAQPLPTPDPDPRPRLPCPATCLIPTSAPIA
jgi:hypothetical protein